MLERYTAVDVETPNRNNDSICSIGIVHMEYGAPVYRMPVVKTSSPTTSPRAPKRLPSNTCPFCSVK